MTEENSKPTTPWIVDLHKMGRLITNWFTLVIVFVSMLVGHELTPTEAAVLTGGNVAYQVMKGKGN